MNHKLIMLTNPILVSDEKPKNIVYVNNHFYNHAIRRFTLAFGNSNVKDCKEIVAGVEGLGVEGLSKLDLSAIAEEIGWVDVEKLADKFFESWSLGDRKQSSYELFRKVYAFSQSLNEKKFSEEDVRKVLFDAGQTAVFSRESCLDLVDRLISTLKKPKEYNVEVELEDIGNKNKVYNCSTKSEWIYKVTKILNNE